MPSVVNMELEATSGMMGRCILETGEKISNILNGSLSALSSCLEAGDVSVRNVLYFHWEEI